MTWLQRGAIVGSLWPSHRSRDSADARGCVMPLQEHYECSIKLYKVGMRVLAGRHGWRLVPAPEKATYLGLCHVYLRL